MSQMSQMFLNKQVQLYPGDTNSKFAIVKEINDAGVVFQITKSDCSDYTKDCMYFIAFSARLKFKLV